MSKTARQNNHIDYWLFGVVVGLVALGILMLSSISIGFSQKRFGSSFYFLLHQVGLGIAPGIFLGYIAYRTPLRLLQKWSWVLLFFSVVLLSMVFIPGIGTGYLGAARWLNLGSVSFQPTELLKLSFIIYLAAWLTSRTQTPRAVRGKHFGETFLAFLAIIGLVSVLLIMQPDISTLFIIVATALATYFLAGPPFWHIASALVLGTGALYCLIKTAPYRYGRFVVFLKSILLKPGSDPMGIGYQVQQALLGIGSGGIFGLGLGMSRQKSGLLPFPMSDSVFAILAEEMGFAGSVILVSLFLLFVWRGFTLAKNISDKFCQLIVVGITSWIAIQTFVNIGAMVGILPLTGIPLPFISYGGSAIICELVAVGLLLNISKNATRI